MCSCLNPISFAGTYNFETSPKICLLVCFSRGVLICLPIFAYCQEDICFLPESCVNGGLRVTSRLLPIHPTGHLVEWIGCHPFGVARSERNSDGKNKELACFG